MLGGGRCLGPLTDIKSHFSASAHPLPTFCPPSAIPNLVSGSWPLKPWTGFLHLGTRGHFLFLVQGEVKAHNFKKLSHHEGGGPEGYRTALPKALLVSFAGIQAPEAPPETISTQGCSPSPSAPLEAQGR